MDLKKHIRSVPNFPKQGILFYDISTLLANPDAWQVALGRMARDVSRLRPDVLAGIDARGFLVAAPLAALISSVLPGGVPMTVALASAAAAIAAMVAIRGPKSTRFVAGSLLAAFGAALLVATSQWGGAM